MILRYNHDVGREAATGAGMASVCWTAKAIRSILAWDVTRVVRRIRPP
jgi:hypothetical protein